MSSEIVITKDPQDNEIVHMYAEGRGPLNSQWYVGTIFYDHVRSLFGQEVYDRMFHPQSEVNSLRVKIWQVAVLNED